LSQDVNQVRDETGKDLFATQLRDTLPAHLMVGARNPSHVCEVNFPTILTGSCQEQFPTFSTIKSRMTRSEGANF